jgi:hypothetical protein
LKGWIVALAALVALPGAALAESEHDFAKVFELELTCMAYHEVMSIHFATTGDLEASDMHEEYMVDRLLDIYVDAEIVYEMDEDTITAGMGAGEALREKQTDALKTGGVEALAAESALCSK